MLRYLFLFILLIHGLIHVLGFVKAFDLASVEQLKAAISKPTGLVWLATALLFLGAFVLYLLNHEIWAISALVAVVLSQGLIMLHWQDAKFGTLANLIVLVVAIVGFASWRFESSYRSDVKTLLAQARANEEQVITENDLAHLPDLVQRYLRFSGVVGQPRVRTFKVVMEGEMRGKDQDWFSFTSEQYNSLEPAARLFFMKGNVKGLPAWGYHAYQQEQARMQIRLLSLFPVVDEANPRLFQAETVTLFNDMCLLAPGSLVDPTIQWDSLDQKSVRATFTNRGVTISATLVFSHRGPQCQLLNFISDDRIDINEGKNYRFSTPVGEYQQQEGGHRVSYGEAVWHYPEGEFVYGKFRIKEVVIN